MNAAECHKLWLRISARYMQYNIFINLTFEIYGNGSMEIGLKRKR